MYPMDQRERDAKFLMYQQTGNFMGFTWKDDLRRELEDIVGFQIQIICALIAVAPLVGVGFLIYWLVP